MGNSDDSAVMEVAPDGLLNEVISFQVHSGCCLVENKDLGLGQEGTS
jgi:hypothetical protein